MTLLADAGPIAALLNRRDAHHAWSMRQAAEVAYPWLTCDAVISEAHFLLRRTHDGGVRLNSLVEAGRLSPSFSYAAHARRVHELMRTYANVPMSFADACLVCMAELHPEAPVFTTDSDFRIYRKHRDEALNLLIP